MQCAERRDACDCQVYVREIASMNLLLNTMLQSLQQLELALQVCLLSCPWTPFVGALLRHSPSLTKCTTSPSILKRGSSFGSSSHLDTHDLLASIRGKRESTFIWKA
jgi:hypothetical protein